MKKTSLVLLTGLLLTTAFLSACHDAAREAAVMEQQKFDSYSQDAIITGKVNSKILADESIRPLNIKVSTTQGIVTLTGIVPSRGIKNTVGRMARHTHGVLSVTNKLKIK